MKIVDRILKIAASLGVISFFMISLEPSMAVATTYGSGLYGSCPYGGADVGNTALNFTVSTTTVPLGPGSLSTSAARTGTSNFDVAVQCTGQGYIIVTQGTSLTSGGYTIANMASPAASQVGVEQYGINLVANTSPTTVGANPSGGTGVAAAGYNTANNYKYVEGDTIASAPGSSVTTSYTISYLANIKGTTPAGEYTAQQTLICVATY